MGDMFCSLTYVMGNIEVFFCLYARHWEGTDVCKSSHSRLLGFLSCLPGIWRALQCIRRYHDTRNMFPHLVNCGKYSWTILYYLSLSVYRIDKTVHLRAFFIVCATINAVYCSKSSCTFFFLQMQELTFSLLGVWDIVMDWSLVAPYSNNPYLRDRLGYKSKWIYYAAMIIDPILRFNWIFYAIYANDIQHSAAISFFVSLSEILRRAIWTVFRVENEHCTNVGRFRASRDVPLPYEVESTDVSPEIHPSPQTPRLEHAQATGADLEAHPSQVSSTGSPLRRRTPRLHPRAGGPVGTLSRVGTLLHTAHAQDFERRRRTDDDPTEAADDAEDEDDDDEDDDLDGSVDGDKGKRGASDNTDRDDGGRREVEIAHAEGLLSDGEDEERPKKKGNSS